MPMDHSSTSSSSTTTTFTFTTPTVIAASVSLFNGARQALGRGGLFGGIQGRDKACGREFRARIVVAKATHNTNRRATSTSMVAGLQLYQVSGGTAELIHGSTNHPNDTDPPSSLSSSDNVLTHVSAAIANHGASQTHFQFTFPQGLQNDTASMVKALCHSVEDDDIEDTSSSSNDRPTIDSLPLAASNRMARESLLLCMGIANFQGRPADLSPTTMLYPTTTTDDNSAKDDTTNDKNNVPQVSTENDAPKSSDTANMDATEETDQSSQTKNAESDSDIGVNVANDNASPQSSCELDTNQQLPSTSSTNKNDADDDENDCHTPIDTDEKSSDSEIGACPSIPRPPSSNDMLSSPVTNNDTPTSDDTKGQLTLPPKPAIQEPARRSNSLDASMIAVEAKRVNELEREVAQLKARLQKSEKARERAQKEAKDLSVTKKALNDTKSALRVAERRIESQEVDYKRLQKQKDQQKMTLEKETLVQASKVKKCESTIADLRGDVTSLTETIKDRDAQIQQLTALETTVETQHDKIQELEKSVKTLQNEKAVLQAGVDAREGKLRRMDELQSTNERLETQLKESHSLQSQLDESRRRASELESEIQSVQALVEDGNRQLEAQSKQVADLEHRLKLEHQMVQSCRSDFDAQLLKIQKLKAERNNYKQKGDSLAKEMNQICRYGTVNQVCKILADEPSRRQEVVLLREQKRKALQELDELRSIQHDQRMGVEKQSFNDGGQRTAELERILAELTEYVSAKEMQLETCQQVNEALQQELARNSAIQMSKNLGQGDV